MRRKKFIVWSLEKLCTLSHISWYIPVLRQHANCKLALISSNLDEKWHTEVWKNAEQSNESQPEEHPTENDEAL